ncbi:MAG: MSHA biogenesis protein MshM [Myxococcota bacterium]|jgi:MSHA biogenesis protein MshM
MYETHFGLRSSPFRSTPDSSFYVNLLGHHNALDTLQIALEGGEGIVKVTGEVGTGKSMLCRRLLKELGSGFVAAYLPYPALSPTHMQLDLAEALGVVLPPSPTPHQILKYTKEVLLDFRNHGQRCVVIVDEAQTLPDATLECIRLLSNLESGEDKLLQIVLVGQPELDWRIEQPQLRQLQQRVAFSHKLASIDRGTTDAYIRSRLHIAGFGQGQLFSPWAVRAIHRASRGVPRVINTLCHKSMICAYGRGEHTIRLAHVRRATADTEGVGMWRNVASRPWKPRHKPSNHSPTVGTTADF